MGSGEGHDRMKAKYWEALSRSRWPDRLKEGTQAGREAVNRSVGWLIL